MNTNPEVKELVDLYLKGDIGYIAIYHKAFNDQIICTSKKPLVFHKFNKDNRLWEVNYLNDIVTHFLENITNLIDPVITYFEQNFEYYKKIDVIKANMYQQMMTYAKENPVFLKFVKAKQLLIGIESKFYDKDFIKKLDNCHDLFPIKNKTIDLRTGEIRERRKEDYFTFQINVEIDNIDKPTPIIDSFFREIMLDDQDLIDYLQVLFGYSINGIVNEQKLIIMYGEGSNGKSILNNLFKDAVGKFYRSVTKDILIESKTNTSAGAATPHIMNLLGARLAIVDESDRNIKLNDGVINKLIGGNVITGRSLYSEEVTFDPTFQLCLMTNNKYVIDLDETISRIVVIPFLAKFMDKKDYDKNNKCHRLKDSAKYYELKENLDQFIIWLVKGSIKYYKDGLGDMPKTVSDATAEFLD